MAGRATWYKPEFRSLGNGSPALVVIDFSFEKKSQRPENYTIFMILMWILLLTQKIRYLLLLE